MEVVACETCHIPRLYAPAIEVVRLDGDQAERLSRRRSAAASKGSDTTTDLVTGFSRC